MATKAYVRVASLTTDGRASLLPLDPAALDELMQSKRDGFMDEVKSGKPTRGRQLHSLKIAGNEREMYRC